QRSDAHSLSAFDPVPCEPRHQSAVVKVYSERRPLVCRRIVASPAERPLTRLEIAKPIPRYAWTFPQSAASHDGLELDSVAEHDSLNLRNVERGIDAAAEGPNTKASGL